MTDEGKEQIMIKTKSSLQLLSSKGHISVEVIHPQLQENSLAVIVCVHGGPGGDRRGNGNIFIELSNAAALHGFTILLFDFYGSGTSDGKPEEYDIESQISDLKTVVAFTQKTYGQPIHLVGESMGATIVVAADIPRIASQVLLWPAFDLLETDLAPYFTLEWQEKVARDGILSDNGLILGSNLYSQILNYDYEALYDLKISSLLIHGRADNEVPAQQSIRAASVSSAFVNLILYPEGGHGLRLKSVRRSVLDAIFGFLK